jgi:hypothetical protein
VITGFYFVGFFTLNIFYMIFSFCSFVPISKRLGTLILFFLSPILVYSQSTYGAVFDFSCSDTYLPLQGASVSEITSSPDGIVFTDQNISITGSTFIVDRNITFVGCKVRMGAGVKIVTSGNVTFTSINTVFTGCSSAWSGVTMEAGARLRLHQTLIRDVSGAAISFAPGYKPPLTNRITDCVFVNTRVGISAQSFPSLPSINLSPMIFYGNKFLDESTIYSGAPRQNRLTGIQLNFCTAEIGKLGTLNTFNGAFGTAAIRIQNSDVRLANCRFQNVDVYGNSIINASFSRLVMRRENTWGACSFINNNGTRCINVTNNRGTEIDGNNFSNTANSIVIDIVPGTTYAQVLIKNNTFSMGNVDFGIRVARAGTNDQFAPASVIENNTFSKNGVSKNCGGVIRVNNETDAFNQFYIQNNTITFTDNRRESYGIFILGKGTAVTRGFLILNNQLHYNGAFFTPPTLGIAMEHCNPFISDPLPTSSEISLNTVDAANVNNGCNSDLLLPSGNCYSPVLCGIHVVSCRNLKVFGNHVENAFRDFHFGGVNLNCDFRCNEMGNAHTGLSCEETGVNLSDQYLKSNFWLANSTGYGWAGASNWTKIGLLEKTEPVPLPNFRFFVNPNLPDHAPAVFEPAGWFVPLYQDEKCTPTKGGGDPESWIDGILPPHYIGVLNGQYNDRLSEAEKWDTDRELIMTLRRIPQITDSSVLAYNWLQQQQNSSAQMYTDMERIIYDVITPTPNVAVYQSEMDRLMETFATLNELAFAPQADSLAITIQINLVTDSIAKYRGAIIVADSLHRASIITQLNYIESQIPNLPDTALFEVARKKILNWTIQRFKVDTFSATQIAEQVNIADACFDLYGQSTMDALRFLHPDDYVENYVGNETRKICTENRSRNNTNTHTQSNLTIWPNPASEWSEVLIPEAYRDNEAVLRVTSLDGGVLWSSQISGDVIRIPLSNFPSGIYLICLSAKGMPYACEKFIISR